MKLAIIVPAHNEAENIAELIEKIEAALSLEHELVVVNDHSQDDTAKIVEHLKARYPNLRLVENTLACGFGNALKSGFRSSCAEVVVPVMGDLCDDLLTISRMYEKIMQGDDIVCGSRYTKGGERLGGSRLKAFLSRSAGISLQRLLGIPNSDITNAFKMYRKKVIDSLALEASGFEISMEIPLKAYYRGFRLSEVATVWRERSKGRSSFKIFKLLPAYLRLYFWALLMRLGLPRIQNAPPVRGHSGGIPPHGGRPKSDGPRLSSRGAPLCAKKK
jgi:glycosyltransferase involved in cell wall biosynthesis